MYKNILDRTSCVPSLCLLGGCHCHGSADGPADPPGPSGCLVAARGGRLHRAGGQGGATLSGHVLPAAD